MPQIQNIHLQSSAVGLRLRLSDVYLHDGGIGAKGGAQTSWLQVQAVAKGLASTLFLAAKIWRHAGRVGVSYSDHYEEKGIFCRLLERLRAISEDAVRRFGSVLATPLTG